MQNLEKLGKKWAKDEVEIEEYNFGDTKISLNPKQKEFVNDKTRYSLYAGGLGSGKTLALVIKMILMCLLFPGNVVLLGRKHRSDIKQNLLPDVFDLMDESWYDYKVKDGYVEFENGSRIVLFGLDALQGGGSTSRKKAEQRLKSLNLGAFFIDQLEEVTKEVFETLQGRIRRKNAWRQGNMTSNPANYWAYSYFIENSDRDNRNVIKASMLDNEDNLPDDYVEDQLNKSERHIERYVKGKWNQSILTDAAVFTSEYLDKFEVEDPQDIEEDIKIYRQPDKQEYVMGIDPSTGEEDPCSIVILGKDGEEKARYNKKVPVHLQAEKVRYLYYKYNEPFVIPEVNGPGQALLVHIKDLSNIYQRTVRDEKFDRETKKLGFKTTRATKPEIISHFQDLLDEDFPKLHDRQTVKEFKIFEWSDEARKKGAAAPPGHHDDNVMATLVGYHGLDPAEQHKKKLKRKKEQIKAKTHQINPDTYV